jgi:hypothetical protein
LFACFEGDAFNCEDFLKIPLVLKIRFATFRVPPAGGTANQRQRSDAVSGEN